MQPDSDSKLVLRPSPVLALVDSGENIQREARHFHTVVWILLR